MSRPDEQFIGFGNVGNADVDLSPAGDLREAAANLFAFMREAETHTECRGHRHVADTGNRSRPRH